MNKFISACKKAKCCYVYLSNNKIVDLVVPYTDTTNVGVQNSDNDSMTNISYTSFRSIFSGVIYINSTDVQSIPNKDSGGSIKHPINVISGELVALPVSLGASILKLINWVIEHPDKLAKVATTFAFEFSLIRSFLRRNSEQLSVSGTMESLPENHSICK